MEYLSRVLLDVNGVQIDDFKSATDKEVELNKRVNLMNKTGFMAATPRYGVEVEYVVPYSGEFDWSAVKDGRLTLKYENGKIITYTGVCTLTIGDEKVDGENETTRSITLGAAGRKPE